MGMGTKAPKFIKIYGLSPALHWASKYTIKQKKNEFIWIGARFSKTNPAEIRHVGIWSIPESQIWTLIGDRDSHRKPQIFKIVKIA